MHFLFQTPTFEAAEALRSTLPGIVLGAVLGVALVGLLGWGVAAIVGKHLMIRLGLLLLAGLVGLVGAVIGDAVAAYKRPLNKWEQHIARRVFGETLDFSKIKLAFGCHLMNGPKRKMSRTPGNTIFLSQRYSNIQTDDDQYRYEDILIHELTHVWQTQHGVSLFKKVWTALGVVFHKKKPYDYEGEKGLKEKRLQNGHFRDFSTEQQGSIMAHYHCCKYHNINFHFKYRKDCENLEHFARQVRLNEGYHIKNDTILGVGNE
ncbi:hypothetical protein [Haliscomenobacter hydrossis]|uniref:Uncharacterized protein n=1 Tax=Haliscomenobacter hydrossis (strain ATCC 27775 / DSM 1100 / LMG 10767 / O) TaxID=760192 RepID=F4KUI2_HALH1|nr:hypothetical protein [Haliscomenobacter hydrossis]AEE52418.1 hypothetical protein Halhy_4579 [Haliscomenobacter hydrossis DSM 1100]